MGCISADSFFSNQEAGLIIILVTAFLISCASVVLNSRYLLADFNVRRFSMLEQKNSIIAVKPSLFVALGSFVKKIMPQSCFAKLEFEYLYLGRESSNLVELLGQVVLLFLALIIAYLINGNEIFLLLAVLFPLILLLESKFAICSYHKQIEKDSPHLFACAKVLLINTETPLISALRIILQTWTDDKSATVNELKKIITSIEKLGAKEALGNWETSSQSFKDFLSFLIAVSEGSSKRALRVVLQKLIDRARAEEQSKIDEQAANLQLYLMGPVTLMLLIVMYPMSAAINFMMQNDLYKGY